MTLKSKLISFALGVMVTSTSLAQTARTVMVQSNTGGLLYPTNFWSANAPSARSGLGLLWSGLTNSNTASFRAAVLPPYSNNSGRVLIVNSNGSDVEWSTNVISGGGGGSSIALPVAVTNGGTGATNAAQARTNLGATVVGDSLFVASSTLAARQALGLQTYSVSLTNSLDTVEIGTNVSSVTVGWSIAPSEASYALRRLVGGGSTNDLGTNSAAQTFGSLSVTNDVSWVLTVGDGFGVTNTATTTVAFRNYMMWGVMTNTSLNNSQLRTLHQQGSGASRAFVSTDQSRTFEVSPGEFGVARYIYVAYPAGLGTSSFRVDGFDNTGFTETTVAYTNSNLYVTNYRVWRYNTALFGTGIDIQVIK